MNFSVSLVCLALALFCYVEAEKAKGSGTWEDREKLRKQLFQRYDNMILPENVTFKFQIALINIGVDVENNIFDARTFGRMMWNDARLAWDDTTTTVGVLRVGSDEVWKPDFVLYNTVDYENLFPCGKTQVLIYPDGNVLWVPPCNYRAMCDTSSLRDNPKNTLECELKFGSWTLDGYSMDVQFYNNATDLDLSDMNDISDWKLISNSGKRVEKHYDCCAEPYLTIEYKIEVQRKESYIGNYLNVMP